MGMSFKGSNGLKGWVLKWRGNQTDTYDDIGYILAYHSNTWIDIKATCHQSDPYLWNSSQHGGLSVPVLTQINYKSALFLNLVVCE